MRLFKSCSVRVSYVVSVKVSFKVGCERVFWTNLFITLVDGKAERLGMGGGGWGGSVAFAIVPSKLRLLCSETGLSKVLFSLKSKFIYN